MWELVEGESGGQTHCDYPPEGEPSVVWSHPIDAHFAAKSLVGWPKMWFQVWAMDIHGAKDLAGYGFVHVPTAAGEHVVQVATWCPEGTPGEKLSAFFIGGKPTKIRRGHSHAGRSVSASNQSRWDCYVKPGRLRQGL